MLYASATIIVLSIFAAAAIPSDLSKNNQRSHRQILSPINTTIMATNNPSESQSQEKRWFPLESNPTLLNNYISKLGFDTTTHKFTDVFSTEAWALDMIPQPTCAVVVLFPMTDKVKCKRQQLHAAAAAANTNNEDSNAITNEVWYITQRIRNACGTIAILHALANVPTSIQHACIRQPSWLHSFLQNCRPSTTSTLSSPNDKASILENDTLIETFHEDATNDGQTSRPNLEDDIDLHFITFVHSKNNGKLYELDGRVENGPICHGCTTQQDLLKDACGVVRQLMEADPDEMRFTILALAPV